MVSLQNHPQMVLKKKTCWLQSVINMPPGPKHGPHLNTKYKMLTLFHSLPHNKTFVERRRQKKKMFATLCSKQRGPQTPRSVWSERRACIKMCRPPPRQPFKQSKKRTWTHKIPSANWSTSGFEGPGAPPKIGSPKPSPNRRFPSRNISVSGFQVSLSGTSDS